MAKNDKKAFLIAQEIKLARLLAGNNKVSRDKALKNLKKWFTDRTQTMPFTEDDFQRIWKGLFYSMWMSDKPLIQEECAENIANLIHFPDLQTSLLFFKSGLSILIDEWFGVDQLRLDKFLMLVRRLLRHALIEMKKHHFNKQNIQLFNGVLSETVLSTSRRVNLGLFMHFIEIFMEELAKISEGKIDPDRVVDILQPFITKLVTTSDGRQVGHLRKFVFTYLITQSDLGLEYQIKYNAWKQMGFPGSIDSIQKIKLQRDETESSDEETKEKPLDPRAGRVNVELPQIKFNAKKLAKELLDHKFDKGSTKKSREMVTVLADQYNKLGNGIYPLGIKKIQVGKAINDNDTNIRKAANRLIKFEQKLLGKNKKRTKENKEDKIEPKRRKTAKDNIEISNETKSKVDQILENESNIIPERKQRKTSKSAKVLTENKHNKNTLDIDKEKSETIDSEKKSKSVRKSTALQRNQNNGGMIKKKKMKTKLKIPKKQLMIDNIECVFERNSGTWVVYDTTNEQKRTKIPTKLGFPNSSPSGIDISPSNDSSTILSPIEEKLKSSITPSLRSKNKKANIKTSPSLSSLDDTSDVVINILDESSPSGMNSSSELDLSVQQKELFPKFEWEEPRKSTEITLSPKGHGDNKLRITRRNSVNLNSSPIQKIKGKSRLSLDPSILTNQLSVNKLQGKNKFKLNLDPELVKNPFETPNKIKKVKINTKLNMSQEFSEHHKLILRSPGIPFDANKKPLKPLLKTPVKQSPINPFYTLKNTYI